MRQFLRDYRRYRELDFSVMDALEFARMRERAAQALERYEAMKQMEVPQLLDVTKK